MPEQSIFLEELQQLLNKYSKDVDAQTQDYVLAIYLNDCLKAYIFSVKARLPDIKEYNKIVENLVTQKTS